MAAAEAAYIIAIKGVPWQAEVAQLIIVRKQDETPQSYKM